MNTARDIEAILFDLDGTLLDTYDLILETMRYATREVLGEVVPDKALMAKVGQPLATLMTDFTDDKSTHTQLLDVYRNHNYVIHDDRIAIFEGVCALLETLRDSGYLLGVVTSKRRGPTLQGLRCFGLEHSFDCIVCADDLEAHKPDPAPVIHAAKLLGLSAEKCCFVGDSPYDIQAGKSAKAVSVAALWGMFTKEVLEAERADYYCVNSLDVLKLPFLRLAS